MNMRLTEHLNLTGRGGGFRPFLPCTLALLALSTIAQAQIFTYVNNDLVLGFRKNTPYTENNEVVVDIGGASNYFNLPVGTTIPVPGFSASQLSPGSFTSLNNLSWSVVGGYSGSSYSGYVNNTLWLTVPRADNAVRSSDPTRLIYSLQQIVKAKIGSIAGASSGAGFISLQLGTSNQFNTPTFVRESIATYGTHILSDWMSGAVDPTQGTLSDSWPSSEPNSGNLEVTTPAGFSSGSVRSDLYEVRPLTTGSGATVVDPHTGTSGLAWYIGYFEFKSDGSMTFTREAASAPPPVAGFTGTPTNGFAPLKAVFTDTSTGSITNWLWNFGDGNSITNSTSGPVTNIYSAAGSYTVSLTVSGSGGVSTNIQTGLVVASPAPSLGSPKLSGGNLVLSGTNSPPGVQYRILTSTNVALALLNWTPVVTNTFLSDGSYSYTYTNSTGIPASFFKLVSP
jgi:PKD repeat protein